MDTLGRRSIAAGLEAAGFDPPPEHQLQTLALAGDVLCNSLFYSLAATGRPSFAKGAALGAIAGLGAVALPPYMGLGLRSGVRTPQTAAMTFCWYLAGGLVASAVHHLLASEKVEKIEDASPVSEPVYQV